MFLGHDRSVLLPVLRSQHRQNYDGGHQSLLQVPVSVFNSDGCARIVCSVLYGPVYYHEGRKGKPEGEDAGSRKNGDGSVREAQRGDEGYAL